MVLSRWTPTFYGLGLLAVHIADESCSGITQQLLVPAPEPTSSPTKTGRPRTVALTPETIALLRAHRAHRRELKTANCTTCKNPGLVFAKERDDVESAATVWGIRSRRTISGSGRTRFTRTCWPDMQRHPAAQNGALLQRKRRDLLVTGPALGSACGR